MLSSPQLVIMLTGPAFLEKAYFSSFLLLVGLVTDDSSAAGSLICEESQTVPAFLPQEQNGWRRQDLPAATLGFSEFQCRFQDMLSVKESVCHGRVTEQLRVSVFTCLLALRNVYKIDEVIFLKFIT